MSAYRHEDPGGRHAERFLHPIPSMTPFRVLVVDDYPDAADSACMLLTLLGHECCTATCGKDAITEAMRFQPDIAILDIGLPDLSGFELARELRTQFVGRPLYLAAITGWGQPEDRIKAIAAGFNHHVLKPADRGKLVTILELAERERTISSGSSDRG